jgi:hypothetical protein
MSGIPIPSEVLGAMITLAVLISASGLLVLSTSNRIGRTGERVRALAAQVERLQMADSSVSASDHSKEIKPKHIGDQLDQLAERALLLRSVLTALFTAIGLLVAAIILAGVVALLQWAYTWLAIVPGFAGCCALLYGSLLLVRETRLAVRSTLQEVVSAPEAAIDREEQRIKAEAAWNRFRSAWSSLRCLGGRRLIRLEKRRRKNDSLFYVTHVGPELPSEEDLPTDRKAAHSAVRFNREGSEL